MTTAQKYLSVLIVLAFAVIGFTAMRTSVTLGGPAYEALPKWFGNGLSAGITQQFSVDNAGGITTSATSTQNGLATVVLAGSFADATTTAVAIHNPYNATSTVAFTSLSGTNGTTTIALRMGTSTTAYAPVGGNIGAPIIAATVATSTIFYIVPSQAGYANNAASTAFGRMEVGPNEYVIIQATSSTGAGWSATELQGITNTNNSFSGSYKIEWRL